MVLSAAQLLFIFACQVIAHQFHSSSSADDRDRGGRSSSVTRDSRPPWETEQYDRLNKQCPCIRAQGSSKCVGYNPSLQAASLEEALLNFRSPHPKSDMFGQFGVKGSNAQTIGEEIACGSIMCRRCASYILTKLEQQAKATKDTPARREILELKKLKRKYAKNTRNRDCPSLQPTGPTGISDRVPVAVTSSQMAKLNKAILGGGGGGKGGNKRSVRPDIRQDEPATSRRLPKPFKSEYKLDCHARGEAVAPRSQYLNLCTYCWKWGVLPDIFYPKYVNMMACDTNRRCLSGWGDCRQRTRSVLVLKNIGTQAKPDYQEYTVNVPVTCDCQVRSGTALHNLVRG